MPLSNSERTFATRWLEKGVSQNDVLAGIKSLRNEKISIGDAARGAWSAPASMALGATELMAKYSPSRALAKINPNSAWSKGATQGLDEIQSWADKKQTQKQFRIESMGDDAVVGQLGGNLAADAAITYAAQFIPGLGQAYGTARLPKIAAKLNKIRKIANGTKYGRYAQRFAKGLPVGLAIGAAQDAGQQESVSRGMAWGVGVPALIALVTGNKKIGDMAGKVLENRSDDLGRIVARQMGDGALEGAELVVGKHGLSKDIMTKIANNGVAKKEEEDMLYGMQRWLTGAGEDAKVVEGFPTGMRTAVAEKAKNTRGVTRLRDELNQSFLNNGKVLRRMGPEGVELARRFDNATLMENEMLAAFANRTTDLFKQFKRIDPEQMTRLLDGTAVAKNSVEESFIVEGRKILDDLHLQADNFSDGQVPYRKGYVSHMMKPEVLDDILYKQGSDIKWARELEKNGEKFAEGEALDVIRGLRSAHLNKDYTAFYEKARKMNLPESMRIMNFKDLLPTYLDSVASRSAFVRNYGAQGEHLYKNLQGLVERAGKGAADADPAMAMKIIEQVLHRRPQADWIRNIKTFQVLKLAMSAPSNIADHLGTVMRYGLRSTVKGMFTSLVSKGAKRSADAGGASLDTLTRSRTNVRKQTKIAENILKWSGFRFTQRWADRTVVLAAQDHLYRLHRRLAKDPENLLLRRRATEMLGPDTLDDFIKNGPTEDIMRRGGAKAIQDLRPISPMDVPFYFNEPGAASLITQFRRFTVQISNNLHREIIRKWSYDKKGAAKSLAMFAIVGPMLGYATRESKDALRDNLAAMGKFMVSGEWEYPEQEEENKSFFADYMQRIGDVGGLGLVTEVADSFKRSDWAPGGLVAQLLGPTAGDIAAIGETVVEGVQKADKVIKGEATAGEFAGKVTSDLLKPVPVARQLFNAGARDLIEGKGGGGGGKIKGNWGQSGGGSKGGTWTPPGNSEPLRPSAPSAQPQASNGSVNDVAFEYIKGHEGYRDNAYADAHATSIGYGTRGAPGQVTTEPQARAAAKAHIAKDEAFINQYMPGLNQNQQTALLSFMYNLGQKPSGVKELYRAIIKRDEATIRREWVKFNKARARKGAPLKVNQNLANRRRDELELFFS